MNSHSGSLTAVGIGIRAPAQTTAEAADRIKRADKVYTVVADPLAQYWIGTLNENTEPLGVLYAVGKPRSKTYQEMVDVILGTVRQHLRVCAVSYGHPGVFAYPFHEAIRRSRQEGFPAEMLAGISAEDCLFAELGIDPATSGCLSYEATDFLIHRRLMDPRSSLILWQIGAIAEPNFKDSNDAWNREGLTVLTEVLLEVYRPNHEVVLYEAARFPVCSSSIARIELHRLPETPVTAISTLYVPPMTKAKTDERMLRRLGLPQASKAPLTHSG